MLLLSYAFSIRIFWIESHTLLNDFVRWSSSLFLSIFLFYFIFYIWHDSHTLTVYYWHSNIVLKKFENLWKYFRQILQTKGRDLNLELSVNLLFPVSIMRLLPFYFEFLNLKHFLISSNRRFLGLSFKLL